MPHAPRNIETLNNMVYAYLRISTNRQEAHSQKFTIDEYCKQRGIVPDEYLIEQASGGKRAADRKLGELLNRMQKGDLLVTTEISRLGRSTLNVMSTLNYCMEKGLMVHTVKGNYELGDNIQSQLLAFAFAIGAQIERDLIKTRTREAIARKKSEGKSWGRQKGFKLSTYKLDEKVDLIRSEIEKKTPFTTIAKMVGTDRRTVKKFCENIMLNK